LRDIRGSTIGIAVLVAAMALIDLLIYPSYRDSLGDFEMPEAMKGFLGEAADISSPAGFLTAEFFSWIPLLLITLAIIGGTAAFAGEEGAGTLDLLLAQPIKRWQFAVGKIAALTVAVSIAALASLIGFAFGKLFVDFEMGLDRISVAVLNMLPLSLLFLGLSLWASAKVPSRGSAATLITGLVVITYFLQILGDAAPALRTVRKASPFYWADASRVLLNGFDWTRAVLLLAIAIASAGLAVWSFERRDLTAGGREWRLKDWIQPIRRARARRIAPVQPQPEVTRT
jgi:ABC-type transport system involved in multi-copper enzyme maturation permease subunit